MYYFNVEINRGHLVWLLFRGVVKRGFTVFINVCSYINIETLF